LKTLLIISLLVLVGCSSKQVEPEPEPVTITKFVYPDCGNPPQRTHVDFQPLVWAVLEAGETPYSLSGEGYRILGDIMTTIWEGIMELQSEIKYYEDCVNVRDMEEPE
jgi:hypothetical protein